MLRRLAVAIATAAGCASIAAAQRVIGPGDDPWTLPSGMLRLSIAPRLFGASEAFDANGLRGALAAPFVSPFSAATLPSLEPLESSIAELSGVSAFRLVLGTSRPRLHNSSAIIPLELSVGINRWLTVHVKAPYHTGEMEAQWLFDGAGATVGANPGRAGGAAQASNVLLLNAIDGAAADLESLADGCLADPSTDERCAQVTAEIGAVRTLISDARALSDAIAQVYGGRSSVTAAPFVPLGGSAAHSAVVARVAALRNGFDRYETDALFEGASPVGAGAVATITDLAAFLADSAYGYALGPITRRYQQGFGDIEAGVSLLVYDGMPTFTPWTRDTTFARGLRQTIGVAYRLGSGTAPDPDDPFKIPTGDGQDDIEFTSATDLILGRRFWASAVVRYTRQMPVDRIERIPDASGSPFVPRVRRVPARTQLGDRLAVQVSPRWALSEYFAVGTRWLWWSAAGTTMTERATTTGVQPIRYAAPDLAAHEVGVGLTWSSLGPWRRGRTRWPIDIGWDRSWVVAGTGGVAKFTSDRISFRLYAPLWGGGQE